MLGYKNWLDVPMLCTHYMVSSVVDLFGLYLNFMSFSRMGNSLALHSKFGVMVLSTYEWSSLLFNKKSTF